jgi:aminomethyltransferase
MSLKRTPLYESHRRLGAKLVEFGGWEMPIQYTSIIEEHQTVRSSVGIFDVSHMGEIEITGPNALDLVQKLITNDAST